MIPTDLLLTAVLVAQLGSPHFATRQRADEGLRAMGERATPGLMLHADSRDPEVRLRVGRLIDATLPARIDRMFARHAYQGGAPWADALEWSHPDRCSVYGRYAWDARTIARAALEPEPYPLWRAVTRVWLTDEIQRGRTLDEAEATLEKMAARCPLWEAGRWKDE